MTDFSQQEKQNEREFAQSILSKLEAINNEVYDHWILNPDLAVDQYLIWRMFAKLIDSLYLYTKTLSE